MEEGITAGCFAPEVVPESRERTNAHPVASFTPKSQKVTLRKRRVPGSRDEAEFWKAYLKQATTTSAMKEKLLQKQIEILDEKREEERRAFEIDMALKEAKLKKKLKTQKMLIDTFQWII